MSKNDGDYMHIMLLLVLKRRLSSRTHNNIKYVEADIEENLGKRRRRRRMILLHNFDLM